MRWTISWGRREIGTDGADGAAWCVVSPLTAHRARFVIIRRCRLALRRCLRRRALGREIDEELRFHLERRIEEYKRGGLTDRDARVAATERFGDLARVTAQVYAARRLEPQPSSRASLMADLFYDFRYALRGLRRAPGFAAVAVATLALGIGANSATFSVVNAVLLRPLPYDDAERLFVLWENNPVQNFDTYQVSYPNFDEWRTQAASFEAVGAWSDGSAILDHGGERFRISNMRVSAEVFRMLGVGAALGRTFSAEEDEPGGAPVAVVSHGFWQRYLGGDSGVVGTIVSVDGEPVSIVGVMPASFNIFGPEVELWRPLDAIADRLNRRSMHVLTGLGLLASGVTPQQAQVELDAIAARVEDEYPGEDPEHGVTMVPLQEEIVGDVRPALFTLLGAVAFVLLIACTNVANLLLTRAVSRQKETGIRIALGADRWRIARQLLVEGTVLSLISGVVGLALAVGGVNVLLVSLPGYLPRMEEVRVDTVVLGATLAMALGTGLAFGLVPAMKAWRPDLNHDLKEGSAGVTVGRTRHRTHYALVVGEVALASALLVGATLLLDSFRRMRGVDPGFDPENLTTMTVTIPSDRYRTAGEVVSYYLGLPERLEGLPGVATVSAVNWLPVSGGAARGDITIEGRPFAPGEAPAASFRRILPNYFRAMGVPLLQGREFGEQDRGDGEFVVIINERFARAFWPDESPIGSRIKVGPAEQEPWLTVVGVVADVHNVGLDISPQFATYEPHAQRPWRTMNLAIRTDGDPETVTRAVRNELRARDPNILIYDNSTMQMRITASLADRRFLTTLIGLFSAVALALTAVGIYGIMGYTVTQRLREMGIRMALGAGTVHVRRIVLGQSAGLSLGGVGIGFVLALGLTRFMRSLLFGVSTTDPVIFTAAGVVLVAVALLAAYLPARRATRVDPVAVLRSE